MSSGDAAAAADGPPNAAAPAKRRREAAARVRAQAAEEEEPWNADFTEELAQLDAALRAELGAALGHLQRPSHGARQHCTSPEAPRSSAAAAEEARRLALQEEWRKHRKAEAADLLAAKRRTAATTAATFETLAGDLQRPLHRGGAGLNGTEATALALELRRFLNLKRLSGGRLPLSPSALVDLAWCVRARAACFCAPPSRSLSRAPHRLRPTIKLLTTHN
jgi:hypothetical protein